jgi:hypothetical protein
MQKYNRIQISQIPKPSNPPSGFTEVYANNSTQRVHSLYSSGTEGVLVEQTSTDTLTNKRVNPRVGSVASSATPTINTDDVDVFEVTALTTNITSMTSGLSGTPVHFQKLFIAITGTASRTITWGASFEDGTTTLPTTTAGTARLDVAFIWNATTSKWRCMAKTP